MSKISNSASPRRLLSQLCQLAVISGLVLLVALVATGPAAAAEPSDVALNEVNFDTDYVEVINRSNVEVYAYDRTALQLGAWRQWRRLSHHCELNATCRAAAWPRGTRSSSPARPRSGR